MTVTEILAGLAILYAGIIALGEKRGAVTNGETSGHVYYPAPPDDGAWHPLGGNRYQVDYSNGMHSILTADGGNGIPFAREFMASDPLFTKRLAKANMLAEQSGRHGHLYPYVVGDKVHDIGFPYMGAPLSFVTYPKGGSPQNGTWKPIEV